MSIGVVQEMLSNILAKHNQEIKVKKMSKITAQVLHFGSIMDAELLTSCDILLLEHQV